MLFILRQYQFSLNFLASELDVMVQKYKESHQYWNTMNIPLSTLIRDGQN